MAVTDKSADDTSSLASAISSENTINSPVVRDLRRQTANAIVLYLNYKRYHWQTFGPLFRDLHKLFDQLAAEVLESVDPLAERIRMIGQDPPAHPLELIDLATVTASGTMATMRGMFEEADRNLLIVIQEMRQAVKTAEERGDPGTVDLFSRLVQVHEKHEWWARDILCTGDGLCGPGALK